jgi:twitching motility two-component system response regulator PilH
MSGTILIADDSQAVRDILQMSLETLGYTVVLAEDGERAMERIAAASPDLIIADVMMPKVNGFQICRRVKSDPRTRRTPVILLTARSGQEDIFWGKDCGADDYITKPFKTQDLEQTIGRLLRERGGAGEEAPDLQQQHRRRVAEGGQILMLRWDPRAMDVFRKKYGEIAFSRMLDALKGEAERFLGERHEPGPVGVHVPVGLSAVVGGAAPQAIVLGQDLARSLDAVALSLYDGDDRLQGGIRFRDPRSGREERLPLLSFTPGIDPDTHV